MGQVMQNSQFQRARTMWAWLMAWPLVSLSAACLDNKLEDTSGAAADGGVTDGEVSGSSTFLAQTRDFAGYADWMLYEKDVMSDHGGLVGTTSIYVNQMPDETTHKFPVGTILFKTMKTAESDKLTIHAMVKRGGNFNPMGANAAGWEYFELLLNKAGTPYILWRGENPPSGEQYKLLLGSGETMPTTEGNCNDCHGSGKDGVLGDDILPLLM